MSKTVYSLISHLHLLGLINEHRFYILCVLSSTYDKTNSVCFSTVHLKLMVEVQKPPHNNRNYTHCVESANAL